jgi:hypothetical protein
MAAAGRNAPPSPPHEALHSAPAHLMNEQQPPKQAAIILGAVSKGVYGPQNTPMLWQFIIAGTKERFNGHTHPHPPPKLHLLAQEVVNYPFEALAWSARPHVGHWGAISAGSGHGCGGCDASCVL